ncbi:MAG: trypsin-like serine protease [Pseudomonadota bacterium]
MKKLLLSISVAAVSMAGAANAAPALQMNGGHVGVSTTINAQVQERIVTVDDNNGVIPGTVNIDMSGAALFGSTIDSINGTVYGAGPNYVPTQFTGVGQLVLQTVGSNTVGLCTASRISATHILTAAHCMTDGSGAVDRDTGIIGFIDGNGNVEEHTFTISQDNIHPLYDGDLANGYDLAVFELDSTPSMGIEIYEIYRDSDELFQTYTRVGFGGLGNGNVGARGGELGFKLQGQNVYEANADIVNEILSTINDTFSTFPETVLLSDFDNGLAVQNALEQYDLFLLDNGITTANSGMFTDTGVMGESNSAGGDSGGPGFINGQIAGVTSFGLGFGGFFADLDGVVNSTFGEVMGDARVSAGQDFIDSFINPGDPIPVPAAAWLFGTIAAGAAARRKAKKA